MLTKYQESFKTEEAKRKWERNYLDIDVYKLVGLVGGIYASIYIMLMIVQEVAGVYI